MNETTVSDPLHSRDQVWTSIAEVKQAQASTDARIGALETTVETGFSQLQSSISQLMIQSRPAPTNWGVIVAAIMGVLALFGGYSLLLNQPILQILDRHEQHLEMLHDVEQKQAAMDARLNSLEARIEDVDAHGSRRWVVERP